MAATVTFNNHGFMVVVREAAAMIRWEHFVSARCSGDNFIIIGTSEYMTFTLTDITNAFEIVEAIMFKRETTRYE